MMRRVKTKLTSTWATAAASHHRRRLDRPDVRSLCHVVPARCQAGRSRAPTAGGMPSSTGSSRSRTTWTSWPRQDRSPPTSRQYFVNSIAIVVPVTVFVLVLASMAAYIFAWGKFKGRDARIHLRLCPADHPAPDGTDSAAAVLHPDTADPAGFLRPAVDRPHHVRPSAGHLPAPQLHLGDSR